MGEKDKWLTWEDICLLMGKGPKGFTAVEESRSGAPKNELREGDLFLREMNGKLYHAGIYCGNNEVIDFTVPQEKKLAQTISSSKLSCGDVCKRHIKHFVNRKPYKIFRKDGGIPEDFQRRVCDAMSLEKPYNVLTFNCLHFALWLLGNDGKNQIDLAVQQCNGLDNVHMYQ